MLGETIDLRLEIEPDLWNVRADPGQLENALFNLAINARDAMPGGGKLLISAHNTELDEGYATTQSEVRPGSYALILVTDTGPGIPPAILDQVFEPFFTTKDVGEGSGLGLSMVYGFAKQSEGHVTIKSRPGLGTSVKLYLPCTERRPMPVEAKPDETCPSGKGELILVLEDDAELRAMTRTMLTNLGYRILVAADAAEGEKCLADGEQVDLLLSDVVLPGRTSGPQFAASARSRQPDLKVLFMSGYADDELQGGRHLAPSGELIIKPFRKQEIAQRLRAALERSPPMTSRPSKAG
jgi:CheY-like chemotaxis protein